MAKNIELLRAKNIHYKIPGLGRLVLNIRMIDIQKGSCVFVLGKNGAGKSTLLSFLGGFLTIPGGRLFWKGTEIPPLSSRLVPGFERIALVKQEFDGNPFFRVEEELTRALRHLPEKEMREKRRQIQDECRLKDLMKRKIGDLSGGEKRRLALVLAFSKDPELILLDEPFSDLDEVNKEIIYLIILRELKKKGCSFLIVSHNGKDANWLADQVWTLESGRITETIIRKEDRLLPVRSGSARLLGWKNFYGQNEFPEIFNGLLDLKMNVHLPPKAISVFREGQIFLGEFNRIRTCWEDGLLQELWQNEKGIILFSSETTTKKIQDNQALGINKEDLVFLK